MLQNHISIWTSGTAGLVPTLAAVDLWLAHGFGLVAIVVGVVLWLMGKRLARPACTGLWIILGVLVTGAICRVTGDAGLLPLWLIAGGIAGGAIGWMLYRICLALVLGIFLALAAPTGLYVAQHGLGGAAEALHTAAVSVSDDVDSTQASSDDPAAQISQVVKDKAAQATQAVKDKVKDVVDKAVEETTQAAHKLLDKAGTTSKADGDTKTAEATKSAKADATSASDTTDDTNADTDSAAIEVPTVGWWLQTTRGLAQGPWDQLSEWWAELDAGPRRTMLLATVIGAVCGLILGLIFPTIGATAGSSLLGTLCMAGGAAIILGYDHPQTLDVVSGRPSLCLLALGLITLLGVIIQWTLLRRRTDN